QSNDIAPLQLCSNLVADLGVDQPIQDRNALIHRSHSGTLSLDVLCSDAFELASFRLLRPFGSVPSNRVYALRYLALNDVRPFVRVRKLGSATQTRSARFTFIISILKNKTLPPPRGHHQPEAWALFIPIDDPIFAGWRFGRWRNKTG